MRHIIFPLLWASLPFLSASAQPAIAWQYNYGGSNVDAGRSIHPTNDGGYIVFANTSSNDGQVTGNRGMQDQWAVKLDGNGAMQWQRTLGSTGVEYAEDMHQTPDGGYIGIGNSSTPDGDVSSITGMSDVWVVKLSANGNLEWERSYGGSSVESGHWLSVQPNGEVLLFAETASPEVEGGLGGRDVWVVRIAPDGTELEQHRYGGSSEDLIGYFGYLQNGNVVLSGTTRSIDGHSEGNHGNSDGLVLSLDGNLDVLWHTCIGGSSNENAGAICETIDGSTYIAVAASSQDGQISSYAGGTDFWIVKLSNEGEFLGEKSFGGSENDLPWAILPRVNGGVYVYGTVVSEDGNISASQGGNDAWLICLDADLDLIWERSLGGSQSEAGRAMCFAPDGGLVLVGTSASTDGDLTGNYGSGDLWVIKLEPEAVGVSEEGLVPFTLSPNPATSVLHISLSNTTARQLEVVDVTGKIVITQAIPRGTTAVDLSITQLAQGTYSLHLVGGGVRYTERFVKQ